MIKNFIERMFDGYEPAMAYSLVEAGLAFAITVAIWVGFDIPAEVVAGFLGFVAVLTGKAVRESVYSPQTYNDVVAAEQVIQAAEEA